MDRLHALFCRNDDFLQAGQPLLSWVAGDEFAVWAMHGLDKASAVPKETENTEANGHFFMRRSPKHVVTMVNGLQFLRFGSDGYSNESNVSTEFYELVLNRTLA